MQHRAHKSNEVGYCNFCWQALLRRHSMAACELATCVASHETLIRVFRKKSDKQCVGYIRALSPTAPERMMHCRCFLIPASAVRFLPSFAGGAA